jgi:hypothetical protein
VDPETLSSLQSAALLSGVPEAYLTEVLTTRLVEARGESFTVKLRPEQAGEAKDALAKALYVGGRGGGGVRGVESVLYRGIVLHVPLDAFMARAGTWPLSGLSAIHPGGT